MSNKGKSIVLGVMFIAWAIVVFAMSGNTSNEIVPILRLPEDGNFIVLWFVWPVAGSIIMILLFSRVLAPLYMKVKGITSKDYKNVYIALEPKTLNGSVIVSRFVQIFLLAIGLTSTLLEAGVFDANAFITPTQALDYAARGIEVKYTVLAFMGILYFVIPLVAGLWSLAWTLEDAGLMRYSFPSQGKSEYFEIQPVHYGYNDILKGYSGISAILYYVGAVIYISRMVVLSGQGWYMDIVGLLALIVNSLAVLPAYLLYSKLGAKFLQKGLKETPIPTKEEFEAKLKSAGS